MFKHLRYLWESFTYFIRYGFTRKRIRSAIAAIVVFTTAYTLIMPAIALEQKNASDMAGLDLPGQVLHQYACTLDVHKHTDNCYKKKAVYDANGNKTGTEKVLNCGKADWNVHTHDESCYQDGVLVCTLPEHAEHIHTDACYSTKKKLICDLPEGEEHTHTDACYTEERVLTCGESVLHRHTVDCYQNGPNGESPVDMGWVSVSFDEYGNEIISGDPNHLICGQLELLAHQHSDACFIDVEVPAEEAPEVLEEQISEDQIIEEPTEQISELPEEQTEEVLYSEESQGEENADELLLNGDENAEISTSDDAIEPELIKLEEEQEADPEAAPDPNQMDDIEVVTDDEAADKNVGDQGENENSATPAGERTIEVEGASYSIHVSWPEESSIPEDAEFRATALTEKRADYDAYRERALAAVDSYTTEENRRAEEMPGLFDLTIYDKDGEEIQPKAPLSVRIALGKPIADDATGVYAVHFPGTGVDTIMNAISGNPVSRAAQIVAEKLSGTTPEVIETSGTGGEVQFEAESLSVYAIVYTVDFHYEVNGKMYEFSIPGGGFISLEHLVEVLEVTEDTKQFVADVASVEFSSPELVWVGKVNETTTVGELKEINGLEVQYSGDLTEMQITEINNSTVEAGDWALISVIPFTNEESLTVTMKNGDQFVVKVTDGQAITDYSSIVPGRDYILYVVRNSNEFYALGHDGYSHYVGSSIDVLEGLDSSYSWNYGLDDISCWWYSGSTYLNLANSDPRNVIGTQKDYVFMSAFGSGFDIYRYYEGSKHLSWDTSGFKVTNHQDVPIRVYMKDKAYYDFTVAVNNTNYGSVSCAETITNGDKKNKTAIIATPAEDCYFVGWRLGEDALNVNEYGATIPAGNLAFPSDNLTLTAVFGKNYTSPATQEINEWVDGLLGNPLVSNKTAHVVDYDNRIYEIDMSASSSRYTIDQDVRIEFITDISRSMYFPETLLNEQDFTVDGQINLGQWLLNNGDPEKVYYVIGDINNTATMYAVYFSGNAYFTRWSIVDASYYLPYDNASTSGRIKNVCEISGNGTKTISITDRFADNRIFTGKIYNSTSKPPKDTADWDRLSYLTAAVNAVSRAIYRLDPGAEIGLVTFASAASGGTLYGADDEESFINALHSIQPVGGTNQTSAFNLINNSNPPIFTTNSGKRQVALLITDGAPQGTTWEAIENAAGTTKGKGVEVWTLGLALDRVGNNKSRLMNLASDGGYSGNAEDADQLVTETKKILEEMLVKATVIGEVYDTVDPAFYPVDASGNPIEEGYYYADTEGGSITRHNSAPSDTKKSYYQWVNNNGTWAITYYNQDIKWPEDGGWKSSFYIKSKEDFMGGNQISTNSGYDNRVEANRVKHSGAPDGYYWLNEDHSSFRSDFKMPYVNVDELSLTQNSTEWTVYLGTGVDPGKELKALWNKISVNQVVKDNGADDEVITITNGNQMYYSDDALNDAAAPDGTSNEILPLSHFVNAGLIDTLLQQIDNENPTGSAELTYRYFPYGHDIVGTFNIKLTKTIATDKESYYAPGEHETTEAGNNKEVYTLTVTYNPTNNGAFETYAQTTTGRSAGKVADGYDGTTGKLIQSENTHKIHVYAKTIEVEKLKPTGNDTTELLTNKPATFSIFRKWKEADGEAVKVSLEGYTLGGAAIGEPASDDDYYFLVEAMQTENGVAKFTVGLSAADDPYYLAETVAPEGYQQNKALQTITITTDPDTKTDLDGAATTAMPYDWTQGVSFYFDGSERPAVYVNVEGDQIVPTAGEGARTYVLPEDAAGYFKTSVLNEPLASLQLKKQVTINDFDPAHSLVEDKTVADGTYIINVAGKEGTATAGQSYTVKITITNGAAVSATIKDNAAAGSSETPVPLTDGALEIPNLIPGEYTVTEVADSKTVLSAINSTDHGAVQDLENRKVTITLDGTASSVQLVTLTNNYADDHETDIAHVSVRKTFAGLKPGMKLPEGFNVTVKVTATIDGRQQVFNYTLTGTTDTANGVIWNNSVNADGDVVWDWKIAIHGLTPDAQVEVQEVNYTKPGYDVTTSANPGGAGATSYTGTVSSSTVVSGTAAVITEKNKLKFPLTDNGSTATIFIARIVPSQTSLVISKNKLNLSEKAALEAQLHNMPNAGDWYNDTVPLYYSFEDAANHKIVVRNRSEVTYSETTPGDPSTGQIVFDKKCQWDMVATVTLTYVDGRPADFNFVNSYTEKGVGIDIVKVDKEKRTTLLPGAVFTLTKLDESTKPGHIVYKKVAGTDTYERQETSAATDENGKTAFANLTSGYYEIKETTLPDGYVLEGDGCIYVKVEDGVAWYLAVSDDPEKPITAWDIIQQTTDGDNVQVTVGAADNPATSGSDETAKTEFSIGNTPGTSLPSTGGPGTTLLYLIGLILTGLAGAGFAMRRRGKTVR